VNDAILVATTMQTGGRIYTLNIKHYPMSEVNVPDYNGFGGEVMPQSGNVI